MQSKIFRLMLRQRTAVRTFSTKAPSTPIALPPITVLRSLKPGLFTVSQVPDAGRGIVAVKPIPYGTEILREKPLACIPSFSHKDEAERRYHAAEAACDTAPMVQTCKQQGERFPLLAARLAFTRLTYAAAHDGSQPVGDSPATSAGSTGSTASTASSSTAAGTAEQPVVLQGNPVGDIPFLCYANIPKPYPQPWVDQWSMLEAALRQAAHALAVAQGANTDHGKTQDTLMRTLTLDWYIATLARLHINSFRVDTVVLPPFGSSMTLAEMAAAAVSSEEDGSGALGAPGTGGTGSGVYLVASLFNHSCEPNLDVVFPRNDSTLALRAARDIEPGEELSISYLDQNLPLASRQRHLQWAYGFKCSCRACKEEAAAT